MNSFRIQKKLIDLLRSKKKLTRIFCEELCRILKPYYVIVFYFILIQQKTLPDTDSIAPAYVDV